MPYGHAGLARLRSVFVTACIAAFARRILDALVPLIMLCCSVPPTVVAVLVVAPLPAWQVEAVVVTSSCLQGCSELPGLLLRLVALSLSICTTRAGVAYRPACWGLGPIIHCPCIALRAEGVMPDESNQVEPPCVYLATKRRPTCLILTAVNCELSHPVQASSVNLDV